MEHGRLVVTYQTFGPDADNDDNGLSLIYRLVVEIVGGDCNGYNDNESMAMMMNGDGGG